MYCKSVGVGKHDDIRAGFTSRGRIVYLAQHFWPWVLLCLWPACLRLIGASNGHCRLPTSFAISLYLEREWSKTRLLVHIMTSFPNMAGALCLAKPAF